MARNTPAEDGTGDEPRVAPAEIAKRAVEQARSNAKARGSTPRSARQAQRDVARKRREAGTSVPYGSGRDPQAVGPQMKAMFDALGWSEHIDVSSVTARWREVVGDNVAEHCEPREFRDGVLVVQASSTAWATQISMLEGDLRQRLNENVGRSLVKKVTVLAPQQRSWTKGPRSVPGRGPRDTYG